MNHQEKGFDVRHDAVCILLKDALENQEMNFNTEEFVTGLVEFYEERGFYSKCQMGHICEYLASFQTYKKYFN